MIQVSHLCKRFDQTRVLEDVSFHLGSCERVLLLGPNGAGKTTLLRILAGLIPATTGEILFASGGGPGPHGGDRAFRIGYAGHQSMLYEELTAEENLRFYGALYRLPSGEASRRAATLLEVVEMREHCRVPIKLLSQGQRKRISIARALMHDPPILLLDEPFSALDSTARAWLGNLLNGKSEKTILLATHQPEQDFPSARRALVLGGGTLVEDLVLDGPSAIETLYSTIRGEKR